MPVEVEAAVPGRSSGGRGYGGPPRQSSGHAEAEARGGVALRLLDRGRRLQGRSGSGWRPDRGQGERDLGRISSHSISFVSWSSDVRSRALPPLLNYVVCALLFEGGPGWKASCPVVVERWAVGSPRPAGL